MAAAAAGPVETAIVAAMKLPDAPNYSWRTEVVDDARTYEIVGATDRGTDYSLVTMPLVNAVSRRFPRGGGASSNLATVIFKGGQQYVIQSEEGWRKSDEPAAAATERGSSRRGIYGGPPGAGGWPGPGVPRGRDGRGGGPFPGGAETGGPTAYSNLQSTLSRPHEEIAVVVAGANEFKANGEVVTGTLSETSAALLLVHDGQKQITPIQASGTFRLWVRDGALTKYETTLEGRLAVETGSGRREVTVRQKSATTLAKVGTTRVEVPPEAQQKLAVPEAR